MVQVCTKCSRANPEDACYCYFDGFVLGHGSRNGGPLAIGAQMFAQPFVFPTGRQCRSFDELAIACQEEWPAARDLLGQGYLESFFGGLGRIDLVMAAKEAGKYPDSDLGLDQLLAKLPSDVLAAPKLSLETKEVNLGVLKIGDNRDFTIHLENQGMRLLHGSLSCADTKNVWLTLGDAPGVTEKRFQFGHDQSIKVKVCGDRLRAGNKPLEAKLVVDSNGGRANIIVRAEVHVKAFSGGSLSGCKSPRQLAEKAKAHAKEAAGFFERGDVETWYKNNGWTYPVQGPAASGLHAIQQFFEALGLVKPPVVAINTRSITLSGNPGEQLSYEIKVESQEKKPVYAHAVSDQAWLQPDRAKLNGRVATIAVSIPSVPNKPGKTLTGRLSVQSNGNQRFDVPVSLTVQGSAFAFGGPEPDLQPEVVETVEAVQAVETVLSPSNVTTKAPLMPVMAVTQTPAQPQTLETMVRDDAVGAVGRRRRPLAGPSWIHMVPALLLGVAVLGVVILDFVRPVTGNTGGPPIDPGHTVIIGGEPKLILQFHDERSGSFGLQSAKERDPVNPAQFKRLTYDARGQGDNIIVKIDGLDYFFGLWTKERPNTKKNLPEPRKGRINTKVFKDSKIEVQQHVELMPGASGPDATCLVYFTIINKDKNQTHDVGIRVLMDTYIGANDGVPFTIPGQKGFLDTMKEFREKEVPDYIEAIEKPDTPNDLGTIARMGLRNIKVSESGIARDLEPVDRLRICLYPGSQTKWDWDMEPMNKNPQNKDSCVALYWVTQRMNPDDERFMGYTYGLSELSVGAGDTPVALSAPSIVQPDSEFTITAYAWKVNKGAPITLELPSGISLVGNEQPTKQVEEDGARVQVSWKVKAGAAGEFPVSAKLGTTISKPIKVIVRPGSIFG